MVDLTKKRCNKCLIWKPKTSFNRSGGANAEGLHYSCKACLKLYREVNKERIAANKKDWAARNHERLLEYWRQHYHDNKEHYAEMGKARYWADPEKARAASRAWQQANADYVRERNKTRWQENKHKRVEYARAATAARRALLKDAYVEDVDSQTVWFRDEGICLLCGEPADPTDFHLDHLLPLSRGGLDCYANVAVTHSFCNLSKNRKTVDEWFASRVARGKVSHERAEELKEIIQRQTALMATRQTDP